LVPGDRLAPVRQVAAEAGVSPNTAAAAYQELARRGVVRTAGRSGTVVASGPPLPSRPKLLLPPGVRNLADGNPDRALLPDLGPALAALEPPHRLYGGIAAHPALVQIVRRGFEGDGIPAASVAVVGGALDGVERLLTAHLRPGDRVVVEEPGYAGIYDLVAANGFAAHPVPVDDRGLRVAPLEAALVSGADAVVLVPRAQNPTGAALDAERAADLAGLFRRYPGVLVVEDDHAGPICGAPAHSATQGLSRWAVVRSFAKSLGPDLRVAAVAGDAESVGRLEGRQAVGTGWVSHLLQTVVAHLLADPATGPFLRAATRTYAARRAGLLDALAAKGIPAAGRSGLNVWVPVPEEQSMVRALLDAGWAASAGEPYRRGSPPALRITISTLTPAEATEVAAALASALRGGAGRSG
jgi:DNA-binding transcriptional MocR family regulator